MESSCPHCKYEASEKGNQRAHKQSVHEELKLDCTYCRYETPQSRNLEAHIRSAHVELRFNIPRWSIQHHLEQISENSQKTELICHHCEHAARYVGHLSPHILSVHEIKTLNCCYWEHEASTKDNLKAHL